MTTLPTQLMACVSEVAHGVRGIPIFGVMTKADKFNGRNNPEVEKRETEFRKHLGIPNNRFARIKNYCEDIDKEMAYMFSVIPQIDVRVLKLMTQVFSNALEVTNPEASLDYFSTESNIQEESKEGANPVLPRIRPGARPVPRIGGQQPASSGIGFPILLLITIQGLFLAILLHFGMKPVITEEKLNMICANYDFIHSKHDATIDGLNELCDHKVDILKPPIYLLGGGIVFVVVLPMVLYSFLIKK
ncbi:KLF5 [Mytilus coruscus]|uniref:KLF5 n=1 Tax=Mytilus coruscus TaxID=42192 RepID=A0A6J8C6M2_MYTCO|nr:KLF5 [Mytilus coruscus]